MTHRIRMVLASVLLSLAFVVSAVAQADKTPATTPAADGAAMTNASTPAAGMPDPAVSVGPAFDVKAATDAYLAKVPADKRAASDAYFEGGYWLQLWDFLVGVIVFWLLLRWKLSAGMRDLAERITKIRPIQTFLYWVMFFLSISIVTFPLTIYEGFVREHKYNLSNQTFGQWMRDQSIGMAVNLILGGIMIVVLVALVRKLGKNWWVWAAVASVVFSSFVGMIAPVYIFPLFNKFTVLQDAKVKDPILAMARANGIPATDVYVSDASRQSDRVSANVSGMMGTTRITLNDNLLKRCSLGEIEAVMGHEMGHYVMNHQYKGMLFLGVLLVVGFAFLNWGLNFSLARWGESWGVRGVTDVAVIPLAAILLSVFFFVLTPVQNTITRTMEYEADIFGLNASQQPDGEAEVDLKLGEYRKLDPGPVEEFIFFDHPSGRTRITAAMRWKAEHMPTSPLQCVIQKPN